MTVIECLLVIVYINEQSLIVSWFPALVWRLWISAEYTLLKYFPSMQRQSRANPPPSLPRTAPVSVYPHTDALLVLTLSIVGCFLFTESFSVCVGARVIVGSVLCSAPVSTPELSLHTFTLWVFTLAWWYIHFIIRHSLSWSPSQIYLHMCVYMYSHCSTYKPILQQLLIMVVSHTHWAEHPSCGAGDARVL